MNKNKSVEYVPIESIKTGVKRHESFSPEFIDRVKNFKYILREVETIPLSEAIENFKEDTHPESELKIWEAIAFVYRDFITDNEIGDLDTKNEVYKTLFMATLDRLPDNYSSTLDILNEKEVLELELALRTKVKEFVTREQVPLEVEKVKGLSKIKLALRWIAVLPVGIIGLLIGGFLVNLAAWFASGYMRENFEQSFYYLITYNIMSPFIGGVLSIYWSTKMAPAMKKIVATIMAGLILVLIVLSTLANIQSGEYSIFWLLLNSLFGAIGLGYMMYKVYEDENNFTFLED